VRAHLVAGEIGAAAPTAPQIFGRFQFHKDRNIHQLLISTV
jgi:hypothetical protein